MDFVKNPSQHSPGATSREDCLLARALFGGRSLPFAEKQFKFNLSLRGLEKCRPLGEGFRGDRRDAFRNVCKQTAAPLSKRAALSSLALALEVEMERRRNSMVKETGIHGENSLASGVATFPIFFGGEASKVLHHGRYSTPKAAGILEGHIPGRQETGLLSQLTYKLTLINTRDSNPEPPATQIGGAPTNCVTGDRHLNVTMLFTMGINLYDSHDSKHDCLRPNRVTTQAIRCSVNVWPTEHFTIQKRNSRLCRVLQTHTLASNMASLTSNTSGRRQPIGNLRNMQFPIRQRKARSQRLTQPICSKCAPNHRNHDVTSSLCTYILFVLTGRRVCCKFQGGWYSCEYGGLTSQTSQWILLTHERHCQLLLQIQTKFYKIHSSLQHDRFSEDTRATPAPPLLNKTSRALLEHTCVVRHGYCTQVYYWQLQLKLPSVEGCCVRDQTHCIGPANTTRFELPDRVTLRDLGQLLTTRSREPMGEQRGNARAGDTGDPRENPPTSGLVRHDSHVYYNTAPKVKGGRDGDLKLDIRRRREISRRLRKKVREWMSLGKTNGRFGIIWTQGTRREECQRKNVEKNSRGRTRRIMPEEECVDECQTKNMEKKEECGEECQRKNTEKNARVRMLRRMTEEEHGDECKRKNVEKNARGRRFKSIPEEERGEERQRKNMEKNARGRMWRRVPEEEHGEE
ncbi:hypothetical protein PR048_003879 [Dryococelus australis]|uniref:Uncharacterized protein n=1 Tax=Dryococelus australis TaxID=614101 RepID=A0ABQ9IPD5_9NEOP|nr:hypothetical protein PR048_003879 [Dryococelus australis]